MKLLDALKKVESEGYTHASDEYSYRGRKIKNWYKYAEKDDCEWLVDYTPDRRLAIILQDSSFPSNKFECWKEK